MRITSTMMTNNILLSLNKNRGTMSTLEQQMATGKKIQKPSDDPIVAARALKFRTSLSEIKQYKTNAEDASSWLGVTEQAITNTTDILKRINELSVQGASDSLTSADRVSIMSEVDQLKEQILSEGNVSYAGRYIFTGYQTDKSLVYPKADNSQNFSITESLSSDKLESVQRVYGDVIHSVSRIRIGYENLNATPTVPSTIAGFTVRQMDASDTLSSVPPGAYEAYEPAPGEVHFLQDTGELIFNESDASATPTLVPATFDFTYEKQEFSKMDMRPDHYFECVNLTSGDVFAQNEQLMNYQVSYSQNVAVNVMGKEVMTVDLIRDLQELSNRTSEILDDGSLADELRKDILGEQFSEMIGNLEGHIQNNVDITSLLGGKVNRLELTISRLDEDNINFSDLLSENEDVDMAQTLIEFSAQEVVYKAALASSSKIIQPSLLDFL